MNERKELCCMSAGPVVHGPAAETGLLHSAQKSEVRAITKTIGTC